MLRAAGALAARRSWRWPRPAGDARHRCSSPRRSTSPAPTISRRSAWWRSRRGSGELTNLPLLEHLAAKGTPDHRVHRHGDARRGRDGGDDRRAGAGRRWPCCTACPPIRRRPRSATCARWTRCASGSAVRSASPTTRRESTVAVAAIARGASILEKHFTVDRSLPGPDHRASLDPAELTALVAAVRQVEAALGDGQKRPTPAELPTRDGRPQEPGRRARAASRRDAHRRRGRGEAAGDGHRRRAISRRRWGVDCAGISTLTR